jgi:hypothetical protein
MSAKYGYQSRFTKMQIVHELLWYLTYGESDPKTSYKSIEDMNAEKESRAEAFAVEDLERDKVFHDEVSWKRFLPPLPKHKGGAA